MLSPNIFSTIFVFPILNLLVAFYKAFLWLRLPGAFGLSIVALVVLIRLIFHPFFKKQLETTKKMSELKPHLDKLSVKHKEDPKKLQQEQMKLYQEAGINPAAGCIFMLIQIPVFIALYQTLSLFLNHDTSKVIASINKVVYWPALYIQSIDPHFLGLNLIMSPSKAHLWYYYLIPVITGIFQYFQVATTTPAPAAKVEGKDKKDDGNDFQRAMNTQMKFVFPVMIAWFSYTLPIGLSLYWNIFSLFSIIQYSQINSKPKSSAVDKSSQK